MKLFEKFLGRFGVFKEVLRVPVLNVSCRKQKMTTRYASSTIPAPNVLQTILEKHDFFFAHLCYVGHYLHLQLKKN